jgi:hypothetical protein
VDLFKHFRKYLSKAENVKKSRLPVHKDAPPSPQIYLKKWHKTSHGIVFCLSNQQVQVHFKDHTELFVNIGKKMVTYLDKQLQVTTVTSSDA